MARKGRKLLAAVCIAVFLSGTMSFASNRNYPAVKQNVQQAAQNEFYAANATSHHVADSHSVVPGKLVVKFKSGNAAAQKRHCKTLEPEL
ncbi:hypothetical protein [Thermoclostridium stercorarium]|uniref:hypothetical protein n=1 Tax=Thermoclostridium stercorarium TaxID=1510 RepID=UPI000A800A19|nr:hypothetical protein [Thermoclostridium stercorarium]